MYLEKTESERFWGTSEASDGPSETKVKRGSMKANIPGTLNKSRKVSSLKITDQDHTKSTSQFRINSLLKAGTVDQVLNLRAQSISLLPTLNLDPYLHHGIV